MNPIRQEVRIAAGVELRHGAPPYPSGPGRLAHRAPRADEERVGMAAEEAQKTPNVDGGEVVGQGLNADVGQSKRMLSHGSTSKW